MDLNRGKSTQNTIDEVISLFTSNIQNSFFNNDYVYVVASGLPNYKVGPFVGSALIPGNQRKLLRFPLEELRLYLQEPQLHPNTPIGAWVNGVSAWGYKDQEFVTFGPITAINIKTPGENYDAGSKPALEITGGGGSGAAAASVIVNGSLDRVDVTNEGSGYTDQPLISIVGGRSGCYCTIQLLLMVVLLVFWLVTLVLVTPLNLPFPLLVVVDLVLLLLHRFVVLNISGINLTSKGTGYTSTPEIKLNSGEGALAQPIVINGRLVSIAIINSGQGYTTAPTIYINGDGFGAQAVAVIGTLGVRTRVKLFLYRLPTEVLDIPKVIPLSDWKQLDNSLHLKQMCSSGTRT